MYALAPREIGALAVLAAKEKDLAARALNEEPVQRGGEPVVVEVRERVVQNERTFPIGGKDHLADGEPHGQIELVGGALTQQLDAARGGVAAGLGGEGEVAAEQHLVVPSAGECGEDLRRPCAERGGEAVLQRGVGR